jgi:hypothetical protein
MSPAIPLSMTTADSADGESGMHFERCLMTAKDIPAVDGPFGRRNREIDWDTFDPHAYAEHNYRHLRDDDRQIVALMRDFFARAALPPDALGLDVGSGTNLYPALAMLPFCGHVDLIEYSAPNIQWLAGRRRRHARFDRSWDPYWRLFGEHPVYSPYVRVHNPLAEFRRKASVRQGSVFDLERRAWDIGTMFFVACSLSADSREFYHAVRCFLEALKPGAPFAAAFMTGSAGYEINGRRFPAVPVDEQMIKTAVHELAPACDISPIISDLRPGVGMVLATGFQGPPRPRRERRGLA